MAPPSVNGPFTSSVVPEGGAVVVPMETLDDVQYAEPHALNCAIAAPGASSHVIARAKAANDRICLTSVPELQEWSRYRRGAFIGFSSFFGWRVLWPNGRPEFF